MFERVTVREILARLDRLDVTMFGSVHSGIQGSIRVGGGKITTLRSKRDSLTNGKVSVHPYLSVKSRGVGTGQFGETFLQVQL